MSGGPYSPSDFFRITLFQIFDTSLWTDCVNSELNSNLESGNRLSFSVS